MIFAKKAKYFGFGLCGGILLALIAADHYANIRYYKPSLQSRISDLDDVKSKILSDLKLIDEENIFSNLGSNKNAEELFGPHVSWRGNGVSPLDDPNLVLVNNFLEKYRMWSKSPEILKAMMSDKALKAIDVSWMDNVMNYDHWDFTDNPIVAKALSRAKTVDAIGRIGLYASLPIPAYDELRGCAVVRFLQLHQKGQDKKGLEILRKTAELSYSSGFLIGAMNAVVLLQNERNFVKTQDIKNGKPVSEEAIAAFKRVSWAWVGILNTSVGHEIPPELMAYAKAKNGICTAALENSPFINLEKEYLADQFPFESSHAEGIVRLNEYSTGFLKACNLEKLGSFFNRPSDYSNNFFMPDSVGFSETEFDLTKRFNVSRIPYFRRAYGYYYSAVRSSYVEIYKRL